MQHVTTRSEPVRPDHLRQMRGKAFHRHGRAPRDNAGKLGPIRTKQTFANLRVNPVRADDIRGTHRFPGIEAHHCVPLERGDAGAALAQMDGVRLQSADRVRQHCVQVGAVKHHVGRAVALSRDRAQLEPVPGLARAPVTNLSPRGKHLDAVQRCLETERVENPGAVCADLNAGADLSQLRRLLIHVDIEPLPQKRQCRSQAADAGPDDGNRVW